MDASLQGGTGGHTGTAPTKLHYAFPCNPHKQNNHPGVICPNGINRPRVICPNEIVGAVPACPPERPRSGVSIPKYICTSRIMHEDLTMDAPLQGDTGGHTGTAPTNLHQTTRCAITSSHCTFDSSKPRGVPIPHHIVHSIAHANHVVCHYPLHIR